MYKTSQTPRAPRPRGGEGSVLWSSLSRAGIPMSQESVRAGPLASCRLGGGSGESLGLGGLRGLTEEL